VRTRSVRASNGESSTQAKESHNNDNPWIASFVRWARGEISTQKKHWGAEPTDHRKITVGGGSEANAQPVLPTGALAKAALDDHPPPANIYAKSRSHLQLLQISKFGITIILRLPTYFFN